jgi:hypothetical protein
VNILVKFPTRSRPERFFAALERWRELESGGHQVDYLITLDRDDESMNRPEVLDALTAMTNLKFVVGESKSKVDACNRDLDGRYFEVLVLASDDMMPVLQSWDRDVSERMLSAFPDLDGALQYSDGRRKDDLMTIPVMGAGLYARWGYVYHPAYQSLFCDNEFTEHAKKLGKFAKVDEILARHDHHLFVRGIKDDLYDRNDRFFRSDGVTFHRRASLGFPSV